MKFDSTDVISISIAIAVGVAVLLLWRRHVVAARALELKNKENRARQDLVISKLDAIARVLDNRDITMADMQRRTDDILAELESLSPDGSLDALIADTREYLKEERERRRTS